jgi:hypothetical protein
MRLGIVRRFCQLWRLPFARTEMLLVCLVLIGGTSFLFGWLVELPYDATLNVRLSIFLALCLPFVYWPRCYEGQFVDRLEPVDHLFDCGTNRWHQFSDADVAHRFVCSRLALDWSARDNFLVLHDPWLLFVLALPHRQPLGIREQCACF